MTETAYLVRGLTCGHCAAAVTSEFEALEPVSAVSVELVTDGESTVTVTSSAPLTEDQVTDALAEAGDYVLAGVRG